MKVAIVGSRHYPDLSRVADYVGSLPASWSVVTGSAAGVDATAARAARERGLPVRVLGASFEEARDADAAAGRNQRLIDACDIVVAFWDGTSNGTRHTIDRALASGRELHVFTTTNPSPLAGEVQATSSESTPVSRHRPPPRRR